MSRPTRLSCWNSRQAKWLCCTIGCCTPPTSIAHSAPAAPLASAIWMPLLAPTTAKIIQLSSARRTTNSMNANLKDQFARDGYLLGIPILTSDEVRHYNAVYDRLLQTWASRSAKGRVCNQHFEDPEFYALATRKSVLD